MKQIIGEFLYNDCKRDAEGTLEYEHKLDSNFCM